MATHASPTYAVDRETIPGASETLGTIVRVLVRDGRVFFGTLAVIDYQSCIAVSSVIELVPKPGVTIEEPPVDTVDERYIGRTLKSIVIQEEEVIRIDRVIHK